MATKTTDPVLREKLMGARLMLMSTQNQLTYASLYAREGGERALADKIFDTQGELNKIVNELVDLLAVTRD